MGWFMWLPAKARSINESRVGGIGEHDAARCPDGLQRSKHPGRLLNASRAARAFSVVLDLCSTSLRKPFCLNRTRSVHRNEAAPGS